MTTEFTQMGLLPSLVQAVSERGYSAPTPVQTEVIPAMIAGRDVIGQAQTGTGKTAAYALPMLQNLLPEHRFVQGLVLAPTRELALQVAEAMVDYGRHCGVRVLAVYGGQAYSPQIQGLRRGVDIVVGTPGRLLDLIQREVLKIDQVRMLVLDEADEMLSMGFIEDIETILRQTPATRQTALFSATLPAEIRRLADRYLHNPFSVTIQREQVTVAAIEQRYYLVNEADKTSALARLFEVEEIQRALIFARTRVGTGDLATELSRRGYPAEVLNGDLSQEARERTLNRFRQDQIKVLVATDVAARGLDIDGISHVFNFDLPDDEEIYVHRIGRTGRAGKTGIAISLVAPFEKRRLRQVEAFVRQRIERATLPSEEDIRNYRESRLMNQVMVWLQRGRCRRERELVEALAQEGYDPIDVAAAALKLARAEDKQRPIAAISEVVESRPRQWARDRERLAGRERWGRGMDFAHEPGMVRLSLNLGKKDGIRPNEIVGAIAFHADIPGHVIGKIHIQERQSLVDVPESLAGQVLSKSGKVRIRSQAVAVQRA
ncbi:MAG: DEAD/DEAH box helicase [Anaerolineales bacterium]|nr:DEAD/DEAH box helicase [Anaerolineales bacterium]